MTAVLENVARRVITKPLWYWETRRPYSIREQVFGLPAFRSASEANFTLAVLTTPRTVNNAAWSLYSMCQSLSSPPRLHLIIDGTLSSVRVSQLTTLFPGISMTTTKNHLAAVAAQVPALLQLARTHPMAGKMAAILDLQRTGNILFSDDDILAFKPMPEINDAIAQQTPFVLYLREQAAGAVQEEPSIKVGLQRLRLDWVKDINVGLMWMPCGTLDLELCERILAVSPEVRTWFPDTMLLAGLLARKPHQVLPDSYVVTTQRQFYFEKDVDYDEITLRHFVGPVRHLMYGRGMPKLWKRWRK